MPKFSLHAVVPIVQASSLFFLFVIDSKTSINITVKAFLKIIANWCFFPFFIPFFLSAQKGSFQILKANLCCSLLKLTWTNSHVAAYFDRAKDYKKMLHVLTVEIHGKVRTILSIYFISLDPPCLKDKY